MVTGRIHSIETCGTVDGPGVRFVIFTQGCPLRCIYCHNPDSWKYSDGKEVTVSNLVNEIKKYESFMRFSGGGVTISGGEPFMQPEFVKEILKKCKELGIHTTVDTSGYINLDNAEEILGYVDLVLLDVKSYNPVVYKNLTQVELNPTLNFLKYLNEINKPTWIRYVLVPNITDNLDDIDNLGKYLSTFKNIKKLELLPFHKMGEYKWEELGLDYELKDTEPPNKQLIEKTKEIFRKYNINIE